MEMEKIEHRAVVREGYQILLRMQSEMLLPEGKERIRAFYEKTSSACSTWAETIYGEQLRKEFLSMEDVRERAHFRTQNYRFVMRCPWRSETLLVLLCESILTGQWKEPQQSYHRISHVWNIEEELMLPFAQILETFGIQLEKKRLPFRPDGIYPEGDEIVIFRNATANHRFMEHRFSRKNN